MEEYLEFTASKLKVFGLFLLTMLFVALGVWLTTFEDVFEKALGYISIGFFGLGFFIFSQRLMQSGPVLIFSRDGIEDKRMRVGLIPWMDIEYIRLTMVHSTKFMELHLKDPDAYLNKLTWNLKLFSGLNRFFRSSAFSLVFTELSPDFDTAVAYVQQYHPEKFQ